MQLLLIDALNLIRRIYAVCESQYGAHSEQAIEETLTRVERALVKLKAQHQPQYALAAFDGDSSWRYEYFSGYKASRKPMPEALNKQLPRFMNAINAQHIAVVRAANEEADDVLATLAAKANKQGIKVVIVSTDKGYLPLIEQGVMVFDYFTKAERSADEVQKKYGIDAAQLWQYFALVGDKTNDIPGVSGIGAKSAQALLSQYPSVADALSADPEGKVQQLLTRHLPDYVRALALVSLRTDIDLGISLKQLRLSPDAPQITLHTSQI
ncbi:MULTISPECIES: 5'-3' exonuclease H3TH domain-containing protein [unclassified Pseudoalteromonas]|uniref:5'-3' exonuclease H3TH domain-containing protein n=1 Tax=unclassified Pseudoalteromonas TaxID=194690 RepID=UPI001F2EF446|nr:MULTISPECIES: 5'-3' exonuclease H3TH domain-containing protein [unclassified Pseudoalteromonas]